VDFPSETCKHQVLTTDMMVEGTHFLRSESTDWERVGRKALTANLSDIASMGADPGFALISIGLPGDFPVGAVLSLYSGMHAVARRFGTWLVGGDTVFSPVVVLSIALTGTVPRGRGWALRSECKPGQHVYVSGNLGSSRAGLRLLTEPDMSCAHRLVQRHLDPEPRLALGRALASGFSELGMIDISDSLANELSLLAEASGVGFRIETNRVPAAPELRALCEQTGESLLDYTLFSGEEYELLFTAAPDEAEMHTLLKRSGVTVPVRRIGEVTTGSGIVFLDSRGNKLDVADHTFKHFV
jgi:thiamine-monophosphate kinase